VKSEFSEISELGGNALMNLRWTALPAGFVLLAALLSGCIETKRPLKYIGDEPLQYYEETATKIEYPHVYHETREDVQFSGPPQRIRHLRKEDIRDMTLSEAVHLALTNNPIIRTNTEFLSPANRLLTSPNAVNNSIYDPAIQETEVFNGIGVSGSRRGLEDALSDFDGIFSTNMTWRQNERIANNTFQVDGLTPGSTFREETQALTTRLEKQLANGGIIALIHNWNFTANNAPESTRLFGSFYDGLIQAEYRQPLWAGSGTEYTRIAGPAGRLRGNVSGVNRGVMIARIGQDISLADFELSVRNLVRDVEELYWDLSLAYRTFNSEEIAQRSAKKIWLNINARLGIGGLAEAEEAQALDSYWDAKARAAEALSQVYDVEGRLRRLLNLPVSDGTVIRPVDEPVSAEFLPDWYLSLAEALTRRTELRRQKWQIKSFELQLKAARSLLKPRLDFVSNYRVNGFGRQLFGEGDGPQGLRSAYGTMTQGDQTGWDLGFEFSMPLGFRQANAQVRNIELRLVKARAALELQEHEISHELADAFRNLDRWYDTTLSYHNRRRAAGRHVAALEAKIELEPGLVDPLLRAQVSLAQADVAYYRGLLQYNKTIADIHLRKGTLLDRNNVFLSEGVWDAQAYQDALRRAWSRSHAFDQEQLFTKPGEFVLGYMEEPPRALNDSFDPRPLPEPALPGVPELPPAAPPLLEDPVNTYPLNLDPIPQKNTHPKADPSWEISGASSKIEKASGSGELFEIEDGRYYENEPGRVDSAWYNRSTGPAPIPERQPAARNSSILRVKQRDVRLPFGKEHNKHERDELGVIQNQFNQFRKNDSFVPKPIPASTKQALPNPIQRTETLGRPSPFKTDQKKNESVINPKDNFRFDRRKVSRSNHRALWSAQPATGTIPVKSKQKNIWRSADEPTGKQFEPAFKPLNLDGSEI
jgi:outer membrane protein TolC